jgi:subtilisin family serine protease
MRFTRFLASTLAFAVIVTPAIGAASAKENPKANPNSQSKAPEKKPSPSSDSSSNNSSSNNSQSNSAAGNSSTSGNSNSVNSDADKVKAKPSTNSKLNPARTEPAQANSKADSAKGITSRTTVACSPSRSAKNVDPCSDFIVVFTPGLSRTLAGQLLRESSAQTKRTFSAIFNGALVNGPLSKMQALANNPNVLVVEDDLEVKTTAFQTPAPWGLDRIDQKVLPLSNSFDDKDQSGANTYSYVVDTGIDATNVDFEARVTPGYTAVLDGRGSADCNGHGTHVAGTIAGKTYGVAKKSTLVPVRVLDCSGNGSYSSVIAGLDWIAANHKLGDAAVVNMSLGGPASSTLDGAVKNLIAKGIHVVVAAGNSNTDACTTSPARVTDAITVGATTSADLRASYSNFGSCLDLFAPGNLITSTWLGSAGTQTISGTSMATPHVAGAVARFISLNPTLTSLQVAQSIRTSATRDLVQSAGTSSPNLLLYAEIAVDLTAPVADTSPTFRKVNPKGKGGGRG